MMRNGYLYQDRQVNEVITINMTDGIPKDLAVNARMIYKGDPDADSDADGNRGHLVWFVEDIEIDSFCDEDGKEFCMYCSIEDEIKKVLIEKYPNP